MNDDKINKNILENYLISSKFGSYLPGKPDEPLKNKIFISNRIHILISLFIN